MRYAIISDIHANWQAWAAVFEDICQNQADTIICLGDVVGYGPRPEEVLSNLRAQTSNFVIGNHDAAACGLLDPSIFNDHAREVVHWTTNRLSPESLAFLQSVPLTIETGDILFVHAEVQQPGRFGYIESPEDALYQMMFTEAKIVFLGHTHRPTAYRSNENAINEQGDTDFHLAPGHRYLVNVGSVGEPRAVDDIRARYVIYDSDSKAVYFRKVKFDVETYRNDLANVGLNIQPYFLSVVDHEKSLGHDVLAKMDDHMMSVPDKPIFRGNLQATQQVVVSSAPIWENAPVTNPGGGQGALVESVTPLPVENRTANPVPASPDVVSSRASTTRKPQPAPPKSNSLGVLIFILAMMLVAFAIALLIIFR